MKTHLIKIGNSRGIRLPKAVLEQCQLTDEVELTVDGNRIVITAADGARRDWESTFIEMAKKRDDKLLDASPETIWDEKEWQW